MDYLLPQGQLNVIGFSVSENWRVYTQLPPSTSCVYYPLNLVWVLPPQPLVFTTPSTSCDYYPPQPLVFTTPLNLLCLLPPSTSCVYYEVLRDYYHN